ncbi:MAG: hypothetical protein ACPGPF_03905 [Pontibacterium sp.]
MLISFYVLLAALMNSAGDRVRGTGAPFFFAAAITGAAIYTTTLFLLVPDDLAGQFFYGGICVLAMVAYLVGESFGWGEPLGAFLERRPMDPQKLEPWQIGPLATNAGLALVVRGAMWGAPIAAILTLYINIGSALSVLVAYTVAFWLAPLLCRGLALDTTHKWERTESVRGALVVLISAAIYYMFDANNVLVTPVITDMPSPADIVHAIIN